MKDRLIPKEKLTAYQRWEVAAFATEQRAAQLPSEPPAVEGLSPLAPTIAAEPTPPEPAVVLPTAEDVQRIEEEARASGYADGYAAGYATGSTAAKDAATTLAALMDNLQQALAEIDQNVADQLLGLAIEIANQVLRQSLRVRPELLLPVVREAVSTLHGHHGQPMLFVNPQDAALVRSHLGERLAHASWRIIDDSALSAGGCRVELGAGEVDATVETRWRRVIEAIGVSEEWLDGRG